MGEEGPSRWPRAGGLCSTARGGGLGGEEKVGHGRPRAGIRKGCFAHLHVKKLRLKIRIIHSHIARCQAFEPPF